MTKEFDDPRRAFIRAKRMEFLLNNWPYVLWFIVLRLAGYTLLGAVTVLAVVGVLALTGNLAK